jgi:PKD repeat protein
MNLKTFYTFSLMLLSIWATAQMATVSGHVYIGENGIAEPVQGYPVNVISANGDVTEGITDDDGFYSIEFEGETSPIADFIGIVSVFDFCSGGEQEFVLASSDGTLDFEVDFYLCVGDPTDPDVICDAFFFYEQIGVAPYEVQFFDLSYSYPQTSSWVWDFGDGTTSSEQNPIHEWADEGEYEVTLTIANDSCSASFTSIVWLDDVVDCGCPEYWDPVCVATAAGDTITFSNICFAECEGYADADVFDCEWVDPCDCDFVWDPVCVITAEGEIITFPNACYAECEGFDEDSYVDCGDCDCSSYFGTPVCVLTPDGIIIPFMNACFAECEGYGEDSFVDCNDDCLCDDVWDPVCVATGGAIITFPNACYAECEGFGEDSYVDCVDDCICPDIWDPVCVVTITGEIITFPNACYAECEGYGEDLIVDCDGDCICPDIWDPVCVVTPDGQILTFPNGCFAECEGFGEDSYVDCDWEEDCYADFYVNFDNPTGVIGLEVSFVDASYTSEGEIIAWAWDFGDGNVSDEQNPNHTYDAEGIYEVILEIETSEGCISLFVMHLCVGDGGWYEGPECQAMFFFELANDAGTSFAFTDASFGEIDYWAWDFGDGSTSDEQNPTHIYEEPGIYFVTLTAGNDECSSSVTMLVFSDPNVWYEDECMALFIPFIGGDPTTGTGENTVFFLNMSSVDAVAFEWDFGDGETSNEFITIHEYAQGGIYEVTLTITTADGCSSSFSATIDLDEDDFTGTPQYSLTTNTDDATAITTIRAYPNPATTKVTIQFNLPESGDYTINLMAIDGTTILSASAQGLKGSNIHSIDIETLPQGLYFARIQSGEATSSFRIIKE